MCGIIGIFNDSEAFTKAKAALALLHNRGRDGFGIASATEMQHHKELNQFIPISSRYLLGHSLHAVVSHVPQPIKKKAP